MLPSPCGSLFYFTNEASQSLRVLNILLSDVKALRPDWTRGAVSALASTSWPRSRTRPRAFGLGLVNFLEKKNCAVQCKIISAVSISLLCRCNIHYKDVVKHTNVGEKFSYMLLALSPCVMSQKWEIPTCVRPRPFSLDVFTWFNITCCCLHYVTSVYQSFLRVSWFIVAGEIIRHLVTPGDTSL